MNSEPSGQGLQSSDTLWQFYLFGGLRILHAGEKVAVPLHRTHSLLAALLLDPRPLQRVYLVGMLYPDQPEAVGRRRLSDRLWLLRRALPELPVEATSKSICLPAESRWLDVEAFERAEASQSLTVWQGSLSLYQGDLLPETYDEWLLLERESLHLQWVRLIHRTASALLERQNYQNALPLLQQLVRAEPLDEGALRKLMQVCATLGQRGAALDAYERYTRLAAEELDIQPDEITQSLADALYNARLPKFSLSPKLPDDASPEKVLQHAKQALARADRAAVETCLERLRASPPAGWETEVRLLAVDYALEFRECTQADNLLEDMDSGLSIVQVRLAKLALERGRMDEAQHIASRVLLQAHENENRELKLEALLILSVTQRRQGDMVKAWVSAEQAMNLGRQLDSPFYMGSACLEQGWILIRQGRYREATSPLQQACQLTREFSLRGLLTKVLNGIGLNKIYQGIFLDAREPLREALQNSRDLGVPELEARTLLNLAIIHAQLGENEESLQVLERAKRIYAGLGDVFDVARCQYHLASGLPYHADSQAARAIALAEEALETFQSLNRMGWEASTLTILGYNLWLDGQHPRALEILERAYNLHHKLGEMGVLPELLAYQGLTLLGFGRDEDALERTRQALLAVAEGNLENDIVSEIYYAHAAALRVCGDEAGARDYFTRAYQNLLEYAEQLHEETARQVFFQRDPIVRRLMRDVYALGIAAPPQAGVVHHWVPSRTGQPLQVKWTLDAGPPDVALQRAKGAIALRRSRLTRILREAEVQGGSPKISQLAEALGVSDRTIKRDLAAIRKEHKT